MSNGVLRSGTFRAGPGRRERFALVDQAGLEDSKLSFKAKGIWSLLLSRTDEWKTNVRWLTSMGRDGEKAIRSGLQELEAQQYVLTRQGQATDGTFLPFEYLVLGARREILLQSSSEELLSWEMGKPTTENLEGGGIVRLDRRSNRPFAQIDVAGLVDKSLSFRSKGLLAYLLSRPPEWETRVETLSSISTEGEKAIYSSINELIDAGYVTRKQVRRMDGTWAPVDYWFFEKPLDALRAQLVEQIEALSMEQLEPLSQKGDAVEDRPLSQKGDAVEDRPLSQKGDAVEDRPLSQKGDAVETHVDSGDEPNRTEPLSQKGDAVDPPHRRNRQPLERQPLERQPLKDTLLSNKNTKKQRTKDIEYVSKASNIAAKDERIEINQPTNQPLSIEEFWKNFGTSDLRAFIQELNKNYRLGWSSPREQLFLERFEEFESPGGRIWLIEKVERLSESYSGMGIYDMVHKDLDKGECPRPRPQRTERQVELFQSAIEEKAPAIQTLVLQPVCNEAWQQAKELLKTQIKASSYETYFSGMICAGKAEDGKVVVLTHDEFWKAWIEDNYLDLLEGAVDEFLDASGARVEVERLVEIERP